MNLFTDQHSILNASFRAMPLLIPVFIVYFYIITKNNMLFELFFAQFLVQISIPFLKNIVFYNIGLYLKDFYKTDDFPVIGRFKRPVNATNSGIIYVNDINFSKSEGMPSGHSILMSFICIFMYLYIVKYYFKKHKKYKKYTNIIFIICLVLIIYMMYTRVLMNVHTIQQTIVGSIIGGLFAYFYFVFIYKNNFNFLIKFIKKKSN